MKRAGFTMIELIFVIVILGILAAVAIPKLAATRTDAEVAKMATNAATTISDLGSYYTSQGAFGDYIDMTNVALTSDAKGTKAIKTGDKTIVYLSDGTNGCVKFTRSKTGDVDGNITISTITTGAVCKAVAAKIAPMVKTHSFGAVGVK